MDAFRSPFEYLGRWRTPCLTTILGCPTLYGFQRVGDHSFRHHGHSPRHPPAGFSTTRIVTRSASLEMTDRRKWQVIKDRLQMTAAASVFFKTVLPDLANSIRWLAHCLTRLAGESLRKLRHVDDDSVDAIERRGMGIGLGAETQILRTIIG